jgi:hypothetical protein
MLGSDLELIFFFFSVNIWLVFKKFICVRNFCCELGTCIFIPFYIVSADMGEEAVKAVLPESLLKKRKREEDWASAKKQDLEVTKKKNTENRKLIYNRAKKYAEEYEEQVYISYLYSHLVLDGS